MIKKPRRDGIKTIKGLHNIIGKLSKNRGLQPRPISKIVSAGQRVQE
jgi:hypothetical protein